MGRVEACWCEEWRLAGGKSGGLLVGRVEASFWSLFPSSYVSLDSLLSCSDGNQNQRRPPLGCLGVDVDGCQ